MSRQLLSELPWEDGDDIARVEDARQALGQPEEVFVVVVALIGAPARARGMTAPGLRARCWMSGRGGSWYGLACG